MPQKLEQPTPSSVNWDVHRLKFEDGKLKLVDDERPRPDDRQRCDSTMTARSSE